MKFKDHSPGCDLNSEDSFDASRGCDCKGYFSDNDQKIIHEQLARLIQKEQEDRALVMREFLITPKDYSEAEEIYSNFIKHRNYSNFMYSPLAKKMFMAGWFIAKEKA